MARNLVEHGYPEIVKNHLETVCSQPSPFPALAKKLGRARLKTLSNVVFPTFPAGKKTWSNAVENPLKTLCFRTFPIPGMAKSTSQNTVIQKPFKNLAKNKYFLLGKKTK